MTSFILNKFSDRDHTTLWMPHSVGCLISYAKQSNQINSKFQFMEPLYEPKPYVEYRELIEEADIICMSTYIWNQKYNDGLAQYIREEFGSESKWIIYGGPSIPEDPNQSELYAAQRPFVDVHFIGAGEKNFRNFLLNFNQPVNSHEGTFAEWYHVADKDKRDYALSGDEIPDPYTDGIFDKIIDRAPDKSIGITFETTRGCPFKCAFCDWGGLSKSKVNRLPFEKSKATIDWIFERGHKIQVVDIIDANLGMTENDLNVIKYFRQKQIETGHNIQLTTNGLVKNGSKYLKEVIAIMDEIHNYAKNTMISFQSHSIETLKTVDRENIKNQKMYDLVDHLRAQNVKVKSEMILGLPGETPESWLYTLNHDHSLGIDQMRAYPLCLIVNTPMYSSEFRESRGIKSKKIRLPYDLFISKDKYINNPNMISQCDFSNPADYEEVEVIYQCNSYNNLELIMILQYWWWYHNFFNLRTLDEEIGRLVNEGVSITDQILEFYKSIEFMPTLRQIVKHYTNAIRLIYKPEPVTNITSASAVHFFTKGMRTYEPKFFIDNKEQIRAELSILGYNADVSKWTNKKSIYLDSRIND